MASEAGFDHHLLQVQVGVYLRSSTCSSRTVVLLRVCYMLFVLAYAFGTGWVRTHAKHASC